MSEEWTNIHVRKILQEAIDSIIDVKKNPNAPKTPSGGQKWKSVAAFVEDVLEEKLAELKKEAAKK
jgi:hypothetical protein